MEELIGSLTRQRVAEVEVEVVLASAVAGVTLAGAAAFEVALL